MPSIQTSARMALRILLFAVLFSAGTKEYCRSNTCNFGDQPRSRDSYFEAYMGLLAEELR